MPFLLHQITNQISLLRVHSGPRNGTSSFSGTNEHIAASTFVLAHQTNNSYIFVIDAKDCIDSFHPCSNFFFFLLERVLKFAMEWMPISG